MAEVHCRNAAVDVTAKLSDTRALFEAAVEGDLARVRAYVQKGVHPDAYTTTDGTTALMYAEAGRHGDAVAMLQRVLDLDPTHLGALRSAAQSLGRTGRTDPPPGLDLVCLVGHCAPHGQDWSPSWARHGPPCGTLRAARAGLVPLLG